ncbi:PREDICTED: uncharacterized protein LOC104812332 isoform X2 [Tarenaya hassleriana]|uniref:uncharacterized protein LOC104812332 isoform X2 n=1 Tax=Tarenaya hassleriana TaxID=28532 RepID=UPI0008FD02DD|nr:PREDICTED: uncharacterized protein LOC104812332 isoform X2 [Tarenaya hassleriana]
MISPCALSLRNSLSRSTKFTSLHLLIINNFRSATHLESFQPLLKKFIGILEMEGLPSGSQEPRVNLDRSSIWFGMTTLLEFLEAPACEEGILEPYPFFVDTVLNHINGDSSDFSLAVRCLKELFKTLGCKLWLRSTLSASVMRNSLLGQCFHTQSEKTHKVIFDLFLPLLQSLEALQVDEHKKERRHLLYFLLHQVPNSSNFSDLARRIGRKIALLIVHRGYQMNPPCPPFECAHMWGPSLVSSFKDYSLHISLRQPALDLMQTIMVSDSTALLASLLYNNKNVEVDYDEDNIFQNAEEANNRPWSEFTGQSKITLEECREWMCIPSLWIDTLADSSSLLKLPVSFSKAVFWARSRFCLVEYERSDEMTIDIKTWLLSSAVEITPTLAWKVPTGSDDGGQGKESKNSVAVSTMCVPLIRTLKRLTTCFLVQMGQELRKQWTWEPGMGESFILTLSDPDDNIRQFGKSMLEQVSNTSGLSHGLKFLCSQSLHLFSVLAGVRHALQQVQLDFSVRRFEILHHFFFLLFKLLKEDDASITVRVENMLAGGFLRQPSFDSLLASDQGSLSSVSPELVEKFCRIISEDSWAPTKKCLVEGKAFIDQNTCQMTYVRLLEILPVILGRLKLSHEASKSARDIRKNVSDLKWLPDLIDWGRSQLKVVVVYWKRALTAVLAVLIKGSKIDACASAVDAIRNLLSSDEIDMDRLKEQISWLRILLSEDNTSEAIAPDKGNNSATCLQLHSPKTDESQVLKALGIVGQAPDRVIDLAQGEKEMTALKDLPALLKSDQLDVKVTSPSLKSISRTGSNKTSISSLDAAKSVKAVSSQRSVTVSSSISVRDLGGARPSGMNREAKSGQNVGDSLLTESRDMSKNARDDPISSRTSSEARFSAVSNTKNAAMKVIFDTEDDPLETALNSMKSQSLSLAKPGPIVPKRQVIQLSSPVSKRSDRLQRPGAGFKRFKPPKLEDWFRKILQMDYFAIVGLASTNKDDGQNVGKFRAVPTRFDSPEQYMQIFQPLVLEEFKAQLQSAFQELSSLEEIYCGILSVFSVERVDDFHFVRVVQEETDPSNSKSFSENDLILFTKEHPGNSSPGVSVMGKVDGREWDDKRRSSILHVRFYLQNATPRLNQARRNLLERSKWHASRILNITPQIREFQALSSIKDIPVLPVILDPKTDSVHQNEIKRSSLHKLPHALEQILKSSFNKSQLQAIDTVIGSSALMKEFDISLIQGPPGTGKTRTIVAIISGLLASISHITSGSENSELDHSSSSSSGQTVTMVKVWKDAALARQLFDDLETNKTVTENSVKGRVLICAQSNAAVDELVSRISGSGLYGRDGKRYKPYLVRVGNAKTVHPNSMPFFLDTIVDQRLAEERMRKDKIKNDKATDSSAVLRSNLEKVVDQIKIVEAKRANLNDGSSNIKDKPEDESHDKDADKPMSDAEMGIRLRRLYEQKRKIYKDLGAVQAQERKAKNEIRALRHKLRKSILKEAQIVVTTLSGCGGDLYSVCAESMSSNKFGTPSEHTLFDAVVIDEAAQALEPATLIPLQLLKSRGTKCIMVGDPKQLPATVISNVASKFLYECSMFERLQRAGCPVHMLTHQYRMHPEICRFPSMHFYDNKLLDGDKMSSKSASFHETRYLGPYIFYDIVDGQEHRSGDSGSMSLCNEREAEAAVHLLNFFKNRFPSEFVPGRIGIITPYKRQLSVLRSRFSSAFGSQAVADMELNTVDGFQGREVDILVLSTVRASDTTSGGNDRSGIGFVADVRRMNVALTRAKLSLWILGNTRTLQRDHNWAALVKDAKERNIIIQLKRPYNSSFGKTKVDPENSPKSVPKGEIPNAIRKERRAEAKHDSERREFDVVPMRDNKPTDGGDDVPLTSEGPHGKHMKQNAKHESYSQTKTGAESGEKGISKDAKSLINRQHNRNVNQDKIEKSKGKEKSREDPNVEGVNLNRAKKLDPSAREGGSKKKASSELRREKPNVEDSDSNRYRKKASLELERNKRSAAEEDVKGKGKQMSRGGGGGENMISKRKKDREAIEAILSSSLIPSQKPKPPKRPLPPGDSTTTTDISRPPKAKKDSTGTKKVL